MSHTFLIVGKSFSSLEATIDQRGDKWVFLKDSKKPHSNVENTINVDFGKEEAVFTALSKLSEKIDGVISIYENYILIASKIADRLGLPGLPIESARACTDKELMRSLFLQSDEQISPNFTVIDNSEGALDFANKNGYPVIIKPANLAKSLLVLKCNNVDELVNNLSMMKDQINDVYKRYAPHQKPKIIIEQFLEGTIHSVDAFVDSDGDPKILNHIVDYQTGYDIGYDDNFHYSRTLPSELSAEEQQNFLRVAKAGCKALKMKDAAAHIEIIMTKNGPRIVEIGARNGGYRERMHKLANGIDVLNMQLDIKIGKKISVSTHKHESCAVLELFPKVPGKFFGINNRAHLENLPSLEYFKIKQNKGDYVGKAGDGYKMCAIIILHNSSSEQFAKDLDYVNKHVYVTTH